MWTKYSYESGIFHLWLLFCWNLCLCALAEGKLWMNVWKKERNTFIFFFILTCALLSWPCLYYTLLSYTILTCGAQMFPKKCREGLKTLHFSAHNRLIVGSDSSLGGGKLWQIRHILSGNGGQYIILWAQKTVAHISASNRALFIFRLQCLLKFSYKSKIFISKTVWHQYLIGFK